LIEKLRSAKGMTGNKRLSSISKADALEKMREF
jgi:hypothetical protein